jgi:hypothetical protein
MPWIFKNQMHCIVIGRSINYETTGGSTVYMQIAYYHSDICTQKLYHTDLMFKAVPRKCRILSEILDQTGIIKDPLSPRSIKPILLEFWPEVIAFMRMQVSRHQQPRMSQSCIQHDDQCGRLERATKGGKKVLITSVWAVFSKLTSTEVTCFTACDHIKV